MISYLRKLSKTAFRLRSIDWVLLFSVLILLFLGIAAIYSVDLSKDIVHFANVKKQLFAVLIALGLGSFLVLSNYKLLQNYAPLLYFTGIGLMTGVLFLGETIRGARGWFVFGQFSFQPVEFMKAALVIALATYFSKRARRFFGKKEFFESLAIMVLPVVLTFLQPDLGSASVLMGIWFFMSLFAGIPKLYVLFLTIAGTLLTSFSWVFLFAEYQKARVMTFLDPSLDPLGQGYNVTQAIIAIGSGGWFGRGLGFGSQSQLKFLPESQTDFIFAVIAEELGFVGVLLLVGAFVLLIFRLLYYLKQSRDNFTSYLLLGIGSVITIQVFVNIGMNLGVLPVTGIGLPFVSYGGSSVLLFLVFIGVIQSIAVRSARLADIQHL
jgi:rod shape determining protein RodA